MGCVGKVTSRRCVPGRVDYAKKKQVYYLTSFAIHLFFFFRSTFFSREKLNWISQLSDTKARVKECNIFFTKTKSKSVKLFCKVMVVLNVFNRYRGQEFKMNKE